MAEKSVMVFTLDSNDIRICESSNAVVNRENRNNTFNTKFKSCITADFIPSKILPLITEKNYDMLIFITSNESTFQSYFHSDLLVKLLTEAGYSLLKYADLYKRDATSLNMSLYVKSADKVNYTNNQKFRYKLTKETFDYRRYGSVGIKFSHISGNVRTNYCFVAVSLPDDSEDSIITRSKKNIYMSSIEKKIIRDAKGNPPDFFIMAGNFGYLLDVDKDPTGESISELLKEDYITQEKGNIRSVFRNVQEGVDDAGPNFFPPFGSKIGRDARVCDEAKTFAEYRRQCLNSSEMRVGWNSRILYGSAFFKNRVKCNLYGKVEYGEIRKMNNVGVIAGITFD